MKILSLNVNGIRAVMKNGFCDTINKYSPDIICIQEVKANKEQFLQEIGFIDNYTMLWHDGIIPGYAGTAIFYKNTAHITQTKNIFDEKYYFGNTGRITQIENRNTIFINVYFPNGGMKKGKSMLEEKLVFLDDFLKYVKDLETENKDILVIGDINIVHKDIDISHPKRNKNAISCLPEERDFLNNLLNNNYTDILRYFYPETEGIYSRWSYRIGAFEKNMGKRVDYMICNNNFVKYIKHIEYLREVRVSDHCPILLEYKK